MAGTRTGVSTLRKFLRGICKLTINFPALLANPSVPPEIGIAVGALVAACIASDFDNPGAGEITD
jgi:hypothetical protein